MSYGEKIMDLLLDSRMAFISGQNEMVLESANEAIKLGSQNPDAYQCAGDACMSPERYDEALKIMPMRSGMIRKTETDSMNRAMSRQKQEGWRMP